MSDIIDLSERRNTADRPDAEYVRKDDFGRPLYCFLLDYEMDGDSYSAEVWAYTAEDAERRVMAMRHSLTLMGQMYKSFPA